MIVTKARQQDAFIQLICTRLTIDLTTHCSVMLEFSVVTYPNPVSVVSISSYDLTLMLRDFL